MQLAMASVSGIQEHEIQSMLFSLIASCLQSQRNPQTQREPSNKQDTSHFILKGMKISYYLFRIKIGFDESDISLYNRANILHP